MAKTQSNKFPTITDLKKGIDIHTDKFSELVSQSPPNEWIVEHEDFKGFRFLPIDKIEYLLRNILYDYKIEILREGESENGVYVCVRLHYRKHKNSQWVFHDGIGATNLEKKNNKLVENPLSPALPKAEKLALRDASKKFGKLFGSELNKDLNRKLTVAEKKQEKLKKGTVTKLNLP
jgi:hypothetical protein